MFRRIDIGLGVQSVAGYRDGWTSVIVNVVCFGAKYVLCFVASFLVIFVMLYCLFHSLIIRDVFYNDVCFRD